MSLYSLCFAFEICFLYDYFYYYIVQYLFIPIIKIKGFYRLVSVDIVRRWIYEIDIYILFVK